MFGSFVAFASALCGLDGVPSVNMKRGLAYSPLTLQNFVQAWNEAPFARYFLNTVILVTGMWQRSFLMHACRLCFRALYISGPKRPVYIGVAAAGDARYFDCSELSNDAVLRVD